MFEADTSDLRMDAEVIGNRMEVSVSGTVDVANARAFAEFITLACEGGTSVVVIDLSACDFIDSSGLCVLARLFHDPSGAARALIGPTSDAVARLLEVSGLTSLFRFANDEPCPICDRIPSAGDAFCAQCGNPIC